MTRCAASRLLALALLVAAEACSAFSTRPPTRSRSAKLKPGTVSRRVFAFTATGSLHATFSPYRRRPSSPSTATTTNQTSSSTSTSLSFHYGGVDESTLDFDSSALDAQWRAALEDLEEMNIQASPGPIFRKEDVQYNLRDTASEVRAVGKGALEVAFAFAPVLLEVGAVAAIASRLQ